MREKIEAKLKDIAVQKEQLVAQLNVLIGMEQAYKDLLGEEETESDGE